MTLPPAIVIHGLTQARCALAPGKPVTLLSAPGAASFAGCAWWREMIRQSGAGPDVLDILDCADAPGRALESLSLGCRRLILLPCPAWQSVADRAETLGAMILTTRPDALDLAKPGAARRVEAWLSIG